MTEDLRSPSLPGTAASDYERYFRADELLALQKSGGDAAPGRAHVSGDRKKH